MDKFNIEFTGRVSTIEELLKSEGIYHAVFKQHETKFGDLVRLRSGSLCLTVSQKIKIKDLNPSTPVSEYTGKSFTGTRWMCVPETGKVVAEFDV